MKKIDHWKLAEALEAGLLQGQLREEISNVLLTDSALRHLEALDVAMPTAAQTAARISTPAEQLKTSLEVEFAGAQARLQALVDNPKLETTLRKVVVVVAEKRGVIKVVRDAVPAAAAVAAPATSAPAFDGEDDEPARQVSRVADDDFYEDGYVAPPPVQYNVNGLPMIPNSGVDVMGNVYGCGLPDSWE